MKKVIFLFFAAALCIQFVNAQPPADKIVYRGYLIRLNALTSRGYGYDIFFGNQMIIHQTMNPFDSSPIGLPKTDAIKLAQWQIQQLNQKPLPLQKTVRMQTNPRVPKKLAKDLHLTVSYN